MTVIAVDADTNNFGVTIARKTRRGFLARTVNYELQNVSKSIKNYRGEELTKTERKRRMDANKKRQRFYNFAREGQIIAELMVYRPSVMLVEEDFYANNALTSMRLGEILGPLFVFGMMNGANVYGINVNTVRAYFKIPRDKSIDKKAEIRKVLPGFLKRSGIRVKGDLSEKTTHETDSLALLVYWKENLSGK